MSRITFAALAAIIVVAVADPVLAGWWNTSGEQTIRPVTFDDAEDGVVDLVEPEKPTYEQLQEQVETLQGQLDAAYGMAERYGTDEQLEEFRQATGWHFEDGELADYNFEREGSPGGPGGDMGDMATQSQNPVGGLWMMWLQNDMKLMEGPLQGKRIFDTVVFQPVMPVQLTDTWKVINRPVFMFNAFETPSPFAYRPGGSQDPVGAIDPFSTQAGLGDIAFIQWLSNSPSSSKMVTGFGWNWMFPAASHPDLGTGRTSLGPSMVAMYLGDKIITGGIVQQYWSIDNRGNRSRVSLMDIQYVFRYRLNPMFGIGFAPNIQWDQVTGKVTVPVGFGFDAMTMAFGRLPMRWGAELQYFASHSGGPNRAFDPEWNFRLYVSPIIKAPEWATRGLLGGGCCH